MAIERICQECEKSFRIPASVVRKGKGRFCSRECTRAAKADRKQPLPEAERFWKFVDKSGGPRACWEWTGCVGQAGYGQFTIRKGKHETASRVAWRLANGRRSSQLILHCCDNPACCNPAHLREGTIRDNVNDALERDRFARGERHGAAKLTAEQVKEIRAALQIGSSCNAQAKRFGVHAGTISEIKRRLIWRHI